MILIVREYYLSTNAFHQLININQSNKLNKNVNSDNKNVNMMDCCHNSKSSLYFCIIKNPNHAIRITQVCPAQNLQEYVDS